MLIYQLSQYFISAGLSPNPSPVVGGALIQDNCEYFGLNSTLQTFTIKELA
jgi:hypothetical protein